MRGGGSGVGQERSSKTWSLNWILKGLREPFRQKLKEGDCIGMEDRAGVKAGRGKGAGCSLRLSPGSVGEVAEGDAEVGSLDPDNLLYLLVNRSHMQVKYMDELKS